ncbi:putative reverse transcriptase domain-containing protein, partial [Tanacetum coccineum]
MVGRKLEKNTPSNHFSLDDSSRDSSSSSSSESSLDSSVDALSDSASSCSSSDHSLPTPSSGIRPSHHLCSLVPSIYRSSAAISDRPSHDYSFASTSHKRSRSPTASVPLSSPTLGALSCAQTRLGVDFVDEISEPSRFRGTNLEIDVDVVRSDGIDINPEIQAEIDECFAYEDALRDRGIDARVVVKGIDREEIETGVRGLVEVRVYKVTHPVIANDIPEPAQEEVTYETLGDLVQRFHDHTKEISVHRVQLEHDNRKLRDMMDVLSQRVARSQRRELRVQREMRQIRRFRFYDRMRIARLEACARRTMPNTRSGASRTREGINRQIDRQIAGTLGSCTTVRNLEPLMRDEGGQEEVNGNVINGNGGNGNGGNGNGGNGNRGNRNRRNGNRGNGNRGNGNGNGNGGGNGYNFGGFMPAREYTYQDFLKCQPLSFNGTEGVVGLTRWFKKMEMMFHISNCLEKYQVKYATCTLLNSALTWWNSLKRTIRIEAAYAMSWAELMKLMTEVYCPRNEIQKMETEMVPNEEDKVKRFIGGLPDNIQGNQPVFKRQNVRGQNMAIAYTPRNNEKKGVGHTTRDYKVTVTPNTQRAPVRNHLGIVCYECRRPGHFRKDCPKLRNKNYGNQTENKNGNKTGGNEATARAYAIGGGGANPDSNIVTGTFLLINCYASMLFDSGADRSFVSSTFSALLDVAPSTLDTSYAVELADGRISETNVVLRGCTLGLLGHSFDIDLMPVELGSFNVIIGMDWLAKYHALIVCDEKAVRIPYGDEVLIIRGDDCDGG